LLNGKLALQALRSDELAVLDDRAAAHECVQIGTTHFCIFLTVLPRFIKKIALLLRFINVFCASS
jgi:hypothetical protein